MLTRTEIDKLVERIVTQFGPEKVILFGSYAKGTATVRSDVDFLVVKETQLPKPYRADELAPFLANLLVPVDIHVYTPEEIEEYGKEPFSFIDSIIKTGKVVFEAKES